MWYITLKLFKKEENGQNMNAAAFELIKKWMLQVREEMVLVDLIHKPVCLYILDNMNPHQRTDLPALKLKCAVKNR